MKKISVIIPVFNEEENLASTLDNLFQFFSKLRRITFEVIVINDGSTDRSSEILKVYELKIIEHTQRRGYGASLKSGIKNSTFNDIIILDADGTYPPSELYRILQYKGHEKLIIGTRETYYSLIRHFANKILAILATLLLQKRIFDLNSGMRLFKKRMIQQLNYETWTDEFSFTTTMTLSAIIENIPLKEIPIRCASRRGKSKLKVFQIGWTIFKMIFQFFKRKYKKE